MEAQSYTRPQDVRSPKDHWVLIDVAVETPQWSVAVGEWDGRRCLATRWNGDEARPKGNPVSHGVPTWFVLPDEFVEPLLAALASRNLISSANVGLVRDFLGLASVKPLHLPMHDLGAWPEGLQLRREDIYREDGR